VIRDAVAQYAERFHRLIAGKHGVASPFGAWLLLALVAPAAAGTTRTALAGILGCDPDDAFAAATGMLHQPHAELVLGAAAWHDADHATRPLLEFLRHVAAHADTGPMPSQAAADAWASERTLGLIDRFPLELDERVVVVLATAIATKVSWDLPFLLVPADSAQLPGDPAFAGRPLLRDPAVPAWCGFTHTDAGLLAGYLARSTDGLYVMSAVGEPDADPAAVLTVTQRLVTAIASGRAPRAIPLFDLPLGAGPAWRITEQVAPAVGSPERYEFLLPAWEARSNHELMRADLGFDVAGAAIVGLLPPDDYDVDARQSAMARYTREGFEAAAVTALGARATGAMIADAQPVRTARVEFTRPHAVVAATSAPGDRGSGDWDGLPVFSAWVAEAVPAE
jgi:hypothetical protein